MTRRPCACAGTIAAAASHTKRACIGADNDRRRPGASFMHESNRDWYHWRGLESGTAVKAVATND